MTQEGTPFSNSLEQLLMFTWIFLLFIFSWISVAVVGRALDNFTFTTLKLNEKSTFQTTIIAFVVVAIEIATIYYFNSVGISIYYPYLPAKGKRPIINNDIDEIDPNTGYLPFFGVSELFEINQLSII